MAKHETTADGRRIAKATKTQIKTLRAAYRQTHQQCLRPIKVNGLWRFCKRRPVHLHHLVGHSYEQTWNYYPLCERLGDGCHLGALHGWRTQPEKRIEILCRMLAVKVMLGEATAPQVELILLGKKWWTPDQGSDATSSRLVMKYAGEMLDDLARDMAKIKLATRACRNGTKIARAEIEPSRL